MFRTLLQREFLIFLTYTEEPDILHLEGITIYYQGGDKDIPNLFCPAAFDRPLMVNYNVLKDNEKYWDQLPRLHKLVINRDVIKKKFQQILHSLKTSAIEMRGIIGEDSSMIKEGLQPYLVKKLEVHPY